ncbi:MAG: efflux RND transporter periplasmic adaptor subunit [Bacteroidales bacterium]|jgi:RND family efflux transporter MFP subunit|nr:efflux RND transporter periplasmic adaptor subunit [Bacteroidales bacterium]
MKKSIIFFSATAAILLSSCYSNKETPVTFKTDEVQDAVNVKTKQVGARDVEQLVEFTANVQADVTNNIAPQSPARIRKIYTEVGRYVSKGDLLVEVDDNSLAQLETKIAQERIDCNRLEELYKVGGVSKYDYDQKKMLLDIDERQYQNLVENTKLLAPSDGIVTARNYDAGDLYNGANPVLVVEKITPVKILLDVNEQYYKSVKVGMTISNIAIDAYPGETFEGRVSIVYPTIDNATRTFQIEVQIPNLKQRVRPGMFARVTLDFGAVNRVLVPDQAVVKQTGSGERFVYVVKNGVAMHKTIEMGRRVGAEYEVISGIEAGDEVVVFGQTLLSDGRNVNILQ